MDERTLKSFTEDYKEPWYWMFFNKKKQKKLRFIHYAKVNGYDKDLEKLRDSKYIFKIKFPLFEHCDYELWLNDEQYHSGSFDENIIDNEDYTIRIYEYCKRIRKKS